MNKQQEIRQMLNTYIAETGVKAKFIADKLGVHESVISVFRKGKRDLYPETLNAIENFLCVKR